MIVVTLLLILVAVTLLVLGLAGGSSIMLIGSIVASLLAAVALVISARQSATRRRAAGPADEPLAGQTGAAEHPGEFAHAGAGTAGTHTAQGGRAAEGAFAASAARVTDDFPPPPSRSDERAADDFPPPPGPTADFVPPGRSAADPDFPPPPGAAGDRGDEFPPPPPGERADDLPPPLATARAARSGREVHSDFSGSDPILDDDDDDLLEPEPGRSTGYAAGAGFPGRPDEPADFAARPGDLGEEPAGYAARPGDLGDEPADYDRASSVIGSARSGTGAETWRSDPSVTDPGTRAADAYDDDAPLLMDAGADARPDAGAADGGPRDGDPAAAEFAEADDDDPADEPLPQAVRPGDAIRVARMDAEVLVVDGRPRYHLADCAHLIGRLTEGLPVGEAVELGFNPCGLCRPVERLVADANAR